MQSSSAFRSPAQGYPRQRIRQIRNFLLQKLWLPRLAYEAVPYLYLSISAAALVSALRIPGSGWIVLYAALFVLVCLHLGIAILTLRYKHRRGRRRPGNADSGV